MLAAFFVVAAFAAVAYGFLFRNLPLAVAYMLGLTAGKFLGSWIGSVLSDASIRVRKYLPLCLFSQAGVAIGLSIVARQVFPGVVGDTILATVVATTFLM